MGMMINRRRYSGNKLPYDAEIEYLESSGTQYIDTSCDFTSSDEVYLEFSCLPATSGQNMAIFGLVESNIDNIRGGGIGMYYFGYKRIDVQYWLSQEKSSCFSEHIDNRSRIIYTFNLLVEGCLNEERKSSIGLTTNKHLYLFGANRITKYIGNNKIYSFKQIRNGSNLIDLIPVRVGQVGYMYDKISGQLFGNAGTGAFILGPDKN